MTAEQKLIFVFTHFNQCNQFTKGRQMIIMNYLQLNGLKKFDKTERIYISSPPHTVVFLD